MVCTVAGTLHRTRHPASDNSFWTSSVHQNCTKLGATRITPTVSLSRPDAWSLGLTGLALALAAATVAGFAGHLSWVLDVASHFRDHYFVTAVGLAALAGITRRTRAALLSGVCAVVNLAILVPYYTPPAHVWRHGERMGRPSCVLRRRMCMWRTGASTCSSASSPKPTPTCSCLLKSIAPGRAACPAFGRECRTASSTPADCTGSL